MKNCENKLKNRTPGNDFKISRICNETGEIVMTEYTVFPGINLIYNDVHAQGCLPESGIPDTVFEISHCREGRIECHSGNGFFYLTPGDMSVAKPTDIEYGSYFPLRHYHGITVRIDTAKTPGCLSCFLEDVEVNPEKLMEKFCSGPEAYIARSNESIGHIFAELYSVPENIRKGYLKVKILELLLFLSSLDLSKEKKNTTSVSKTQADLAKDIARYLTGNMDKRITIEELSDMFHISETQLKSSFRAVYGNSVYAYIREQKMQAAGLMLRSGNATVLEVAGKFGYDNSSKFAKAFSDVMGVTPSEYRKENIPPSHGNT